MLRVRRGTVVVALALAAALLPACSRGGGGGYDVTAYFDKAVSLYPRGDVKVLGLSAGKISEVKVVGTQVRVRMHMDKDTPLPQDVQATIVPFSLIGERYVQLFPAWTRGEPQAPPGAVIPRERTSIPVEPDQALAALKKFLDTLDPNATGRLIKNLSEDLKGNGQTLNDALGQFAQLSTTIADKDQQLAHLIDNFDQFTTTLRTREGQLGKVMDEFATTTGLLAQERDTIKKLIDGLAQVTTAGLALVDKHAGPLNTDLNTLTATLESVNANFDSVRKLLTATPRLIAGTNLDGQQGLLAAYDPAFHHIDLRQATTPTLALLLQALGIPSTGICLPIDVTCTTAATNKSISTSADGIAVASPVDHIVGFLGSPTGTDAAAARTSALAASDALPAPRAHGWMTALRRMARSVAEALS